MRHHRDITDPVEVGTLADQLQRCLDPETVGRIRGITPFGLLQLVEVERTTALASSGRHGTRGACSPRTARPCMRTQVVGQEVFGYGMLNCPDANLGLARHQLRTIAGQMVVQGARRAD